MVFVGFLGGRSRPTIATLAIAITLGVGYLDYLTGPHISISEFYLLPLGLAAWRVGIRFSLFIAAMSVALWIGANVAKGNVNLSNASFASWAATQLVSYLVIVVILTRLRVLQQNLEKRALERAKQLTVEIRERERLQRELLEISEREQRRIGQDLHDGLCQHLAGTALTCQALREELAEKGSTETDAAQKIVDLIEEGVVLSRRSAKGLHPVELDGDGLMLELEEFATTTSRLFGVDCRLVCDSPVLIENAQLGEHLYRIAQEAVRNAVKHGRAKTVTITLNTLEDGLELRIEDDGIGIPEPLPANRGLGLRIMPYRAHIIGAAFDIRPRPTGGTSAVCKLPLAPEEQEGLNHEYAGA